MLYYKYIQQKEGYMFEPGSRQHSVCWYLGIYDIKYNKETVSKITDFLYDYCSLLTTRDTLNNLNRTKAPRVILEPKQLQLQQKFSDLKESLTSEVIQEVLFLTNNLPTYKDKRDKKILRLKELREFLLNFSLSKEDIYKKAIRLEGSAFSKQ
tara:strand:- start:1332 stop:1790 length:459 start_codon:yes stop_codon:yes gene_type:complete